MTYSTPNDTAVYTQAILTIFDSLPTGQLHQLSRDIDLKLPRAAELEDLEIEALLALKELIRASELTRRMS